MTCCLLQMAERQTTQKWTFVCCACRLGWQPGDLHDPGAGSAAAPAAGCSAALLPGYHDPDLSAWPGALVLLRHSQKEETHPLLPHHGSLLSGVHVLPLHHRDFTTRGRQPAAGVHCDNWHDSYDCLSNSHQEEPWKCHDDRTQSTQASGGYQGLPTA